MKAGAEEQIARVRRICAALPETSEKLSHGEPTFFVRKKVFTMFANNHHNDGHIAVWIPAPAGHQAALIKGSPATFFRPPYVGVRGWVGVELNSIGDQELASLIEEAWRMVAPQKMRAALDAGPVTPPSSAPVRVGAPARSRLPARRSSTPR
jgi:hypothetical protein